MFADKNNDTKVDERDQDKNDKGGILNSDSQLHGLQKESEFVVGCSFLDSWRADFFF